MGGVAGSKPPRMCGNFRFAADLLGGERQWVAALFSSDEAAVGRCCSFGMANLSGFAVFFIVVGALLGGGDFCGSVVTGHGGGVVIGAFVTSRLR